MPADNRVLVLDSNAASRKRLAGILGRLGYAVTATDRAVAARIAWEIEAPAIVLMAANDPIADSLAQIADLRLRLPESILIVIGRRSLDAALAAWHAGADDYLPRPVQEPELLGALERVDQTRQLWAARLAQQEARVRLALLNESASQAADVAGMRALMNDLAHQINNPLTPIIGMAELLIEDLPPDHTAHEYVRVIIASAVRIRDVVWRLAEIAQPGD